MIVLAVLLWIQVALMIYLGLASISAVKEQTQHGRVATVIVITFPFFTAVSIASALAVGGLV